MSEVYKAIVSVMTDIGTTGIAKGRNNQQQGYKFRGIDDVYNELNGLLSKHSLVMLPRVTSREQVERQTAKGTPLFFTNVAVDFTLASAKDGSTAVISTVGEAMDSGDKSSNKALSAAYKYAAMMVFCIPTEGDNDADAVAHDVAPPLAQKPPKAPHDANPLVRDVYTKLDKGLNEISRSGVATIEDLKLYWTNNAETIAKLPAGFKKELEAKKDEIKTSFQAKAA